MSASGDSAVAGFLIRDERPGDLEAIGDVNRLAFGGEAEAILVDRLRAGGCVIASLVAETAGRIVGHILFSEVRIDTPDGAVPAASLAPMAVLPHFQRNGIGAALVRRGLDVCRERGWSIVLVVGHPRYYPRFGFSAALAGRLRNPFAFGDAFMALELAPAALAGISGTVVYPDAFREME